MQNGRLGLIYHPPLISTILVIGAYPVSDNRTDGFNNWEQLSQKWRFITRLRKASYEEPRSRNKGDKTLFTTAALLFIPGVTHRETNYTIRIPS